MQLGYWLVAQRKLFFILLGVLSLLVLSAINIYRFQVPASKQLYHQLFYINPLHARLWNSRSINVHSEQTTAAVTPLYVESYRALPGDTYWDIAKKTGIAIDTLISYNNPKESYMVRPGDLVQVPNQNGILHQRHPTETLATLSEQYGIAREHILYFNPVWEELQTVFIPGAYFSYNERLKKLGGEFGSPLKNVRITSGFGMRIHPITKRRSFHKGLDLGAAIGSSVHAASGGTVITAHSVYGYGAVVIISHGNQKFTRYAHLSATNVAVGARVVRGQLIGRVGSSGMSTGPHLHFEAWKQGKPINPLGVTDFFSAP